MFFNHGLNSFVSCKLLCPQVAGCLLEPARSHSEGALLKLKKPLK